MQNAVKHLFPNHKEVDSSLRSDYTLIKKVEEVLSEANDRVK